MKRVRVIRFRQSLLSRYLLILLVAVAFVPIFLPASFLGSWLVSRMIFPEPAVSPEVKLYQSSYDLTQMWHKEALQLKTATEDQILQRLKQLKQKYPAASLFRVDHEGRTTLQLPEQSRLPKFWSTEQLIDYMKNGQNGQQTFTIVAFIGDNPDTGRGFIAFELPRSLLNPSSVRRADGRFYGLLLAMLILLFVGMSYWFIRDIKRRLLRLSAAMDNPPAGGIPQPIKPGRPDEIGMLEQAFNGMIAELRLSRRREQEEEALRKSLISNLSHDLRTPLTVINSHLYSLKDEPLTEKGRSSVALMETKMDDLSGLIDHLLSYNLLISGKYKLEPHPQDVHRLVRESAAAWYPLWENRQIEPEIELGSQPLSWTVDSQAFRRVLDNLFQNIVRHAASGQYIGLFAEQRRGQAALAIRDRGPGMEADSTNKGAGLGLAIVDLLLKEMGLVRETESSSEGTTTWIYPRPGQLN
ncbi:histidine kinase [Paenibacillus yonginensis]|uniref:histidine kinase n=1 Tax=Paenibacillus yonginensis TaxID=1462996 RepID=A0A1B1N7A5_9BACL|nr:histidine kinase [Paenibacillus yonginensis]